MYRWITYVISSSMFAGVFVNRNPQAIDYSNSSSSSSSFVPMNAFRCMFTNSIYNTERHFRRNVVKSAIGCVERAVRRWVEAAQVDQWRLPISRSVWMQARTDNKTPSYSNVWAYFSACLNWYSVNFHIRIASSVHVTGFGFHASKYVRDGVLRNFTSTCEIRAKKKFREFIGSQRYFIESNNIFTNALVNMHRLLSSTAYLLQTINNRLYFHNNV